MNISIMKALSVLLLKHFSSVERFTNGEKNMNIYDVSQKAGVSIATVSRVLNGNPNVSESTRQKVLNVMKEIGICNVPIDF